MANHKQHPQVAVVMVPLPAQGHLNQLLHLSRLVSAAASIPVYYVGSATHIRQAKLRVHGWNPSSAANLRFHEFPTPSFQNPAPNPNSSTKFPSQIFPSLSASMNLRHPLHAFVAGISTEYSRTIIIFDSLMSYVVQDMDSIPNTESYCFVSISAFTYYSFLWETAGKPDLPAGAANILNEIPCRDDFFTPEFSDFSTLQHSSMKKIAGNIYNSSRLIEGTYLNLLEQEKGEKVWAIGPFNPTVITTIEQEKVLDSRNRHKCLGWLDKQEPNSVIFVSFGSTTSLSDEQIQELAIGLERSAQKFIWVVREADKGDIFEGESRKAELPGGFEERVSKRGIVVREWAPQLEILGHSSTGGFMSHCGWNSCMESISMGVPMVTWPMHSDQPRNGFLVTKVLRVGVEVRDWGHFRDKVVSSVMVENAVRALMESEEIRKRAEELGAAVRNSFMEGGSGGKEMKSFIAHISR
ncbi:hypothetical protein ABFS83_11G009500 [Erythranthe nasuta]